MRYVCSPGKVAYRDKEAMGQTLPISSADKIFPGKRIHYAEQATDSSAKTGQTVPHNPA